MQQILIGPSHIKYLCVAPFDKISGLQYRNGPEPLQHVAAKDKRKKKRNKLNLKPTICLKKKKKPVHAN